jgi:death-on-curing family protein
MIQSMRTAFDSDVSGRPKYDSFESSVRQIYQSFGGVDCYDTLEEKDAMLLYLIVKNHSFVDGNKRIAAASFLYFLNKNNLLYKSDGKPVIDDNTLFALTILVAESDKSEMETTKNMIITILNARN